MSRTSGPYDDPSIFAALAVSLCVIGLALPIPSSIPLLCLVAGALFSVWLDRNGRSGKIPGPLTAAFVAFLLACGLSIFFSEDRVRSLELSASWIPGILLFVVVGERFRNARDIRALFASYCLLALGLSIALLQARWSHGPNPHDWLLDLGVPILVVPNDCHLLALTTPFGLILFREKPLSALGVLGLLSMVFTGLAIVALGSRGAVLTLITCLVVAGTLLRPRLGLMLGLCLLTLVVLGDGMMGFPLSSKFTNVIDTRLSLWMMAWDMFLDEPLLGHGPYTYKTLYSAYLDSTEFPDWIRLDPWGGDVPWAHNLYLELLAERGIVGLLSFGALVWAALFYGFRSLRTLGVQGAGFATACLASLAGFLASGLFEASFLRIWAVVLLFCLMGVVGQLASWPPGANAGVDGGAGRRADCGAEAKAKDPKKSGRKSRPGDRSQSGGSGRVHGKKKKSRRRAASRKKRRS